jgi:hypothetical protein
MTYAHVGPDRKCPACHQRIEHELDCPYEGMSVLDAWRESRRHLNPGTSQPSADSAATPTTAKEATAKDLG